MNDLGTLGGAFINSAGYALNDSGWVVGASSSVGADTIDNPGEFMIYSNGQAHAFLYENGTMLDLNSLIAPGSGWTLLSATGINNSNQITGYGTDPSGHTEAFLLNPTGFFAPPISSPVTQTGTVPSGTNKSVTVTSASGSAGTLQATFSSTTGGSLAVTQGVSSLSDLLNGGGNPYGAGAPTFALPADGSVVQVWDLAFSGGSFTGPVQLVFTFDPTGMTPSQESELAIYHFVNGQWVDIHGTIDTTNDTITVTTDSFSPFALGLEVPEPASLAMFGLGVLLLLQRRKAKLATTEMTYR